MRASWRLPTSEQGCTLLSDTITRGNGIFRPEDDIDNIVSEPWWSRFLRHFANKVSFGWCHNISRDEGVRALRQSTFPFLILQIECFTRRSWQPIVLCFVKHYELVTDDAQFRVAQVAIDDWSSRRDEVRQPDVRRTIDCWRRLSLILGHELALSATNDVSGVRHSTGHRLQLAPQNGAEWEMTFGYYIIDMLHLTILLDEIRTRGVEWLLCACRLSFRIGMHERGFVQGLSLMTESADEWITVPSSCLLLDSSHNGC
jgi:hypothetical protein